MPSVTELYARGTTLAARLLPDDTLLLIQRIAIGTIFFLSGRSKVDGLLHITDGTYELFQTDYRLPLVPPDIAAHAATYAEHLFPIMLVLGFGARFAALG